MKTNDFNKPLTAHQLNENMYKKFGVKMNFDRYTREELENYRNLLRTKISQHEQRNGFNDLLTDESYQKDKYLVGLLNTRIKEIVGESRVDEKAVSKKQQRFMGMVHAAQKGEKPASKEVAKAAKSMKKKDAEDFASTKHKGLPEKKMKKKVKEDIMSVAELAQLHAMEYMKAHRAGKLDHAMHHKTQCEACGGKLTHGPMGEVYHTHTGIQEGMPYAVTEGGVAAGLGAGIGAALGGPAGAMAGGAMGSAVGSANESKKPLKGGQKKLDVDKDGDIEADDLKDLRSGKKVKEDMKTGDSYKTHKGGTVTKTKTGIVHKAGPKNYGGSSQEIDPDVGRDAPPEAKKKSKVKENLQLAQTARLNFLREDEEEKAKTITAGTDMVNDFTTWMTRIGQYQTKSMIELADAIRQEFGQMESEAFKQAVAPALEQALQALTQTRETISTAVATLASGGTPSPMGGAMAGAPAEPGMEPPMDAGMPPEDEFAAADAAAGGAEVPGREQREARQLFNRKLSEAHSLIRSLSK